MKNDVALGAGPLAAILLGFALMPFREITTAANLAFAFMALTIVTAELGGRAAAIATALTSALSLDFFLTRPYLKLAIEEHNDVATFVGLAVCGLIAARLGSYRGERLVALGAVSEQRQLLSRLLKSSDDGPLDASRLAATLEACVRVLPLAGAVIRDPESRLLASARSSDADRPAPAEVVETGTLHGDSGTGWGAPLPEHGARIALRAGAQPTGWLDIWGNGRPADAQARAALADVARLLSVLLRSRP